MTTAEAELQLIDRAVWGARPPSRPIKDMRYPVPTVFVHHEAGSIFVALDELSERARMRSIQNFSIDRRRYPDIPYSIAAFPSGRMYEGRDIRDEDAATRQAGTSLSIVCPGNYERQAPTEALIVGIALVIRLAIATRKLTANVAILGHRDNNDTACPGIHLYNAIPRIRTLVFSTYPVAAPPVVLVPAPPVVSEGRMADLMFRFPTKTTDPNRTATVRVDEHGRQFVMYDGAALNAAGRGDRPLGNARVLSYAEDVPEGWPILGFMQVEPSAANPHGGVLMQVGAPDGTAHDRFYRMP